MSPKKLLNHYIDHTALSPVLTKEGATQLCEEAKKFKFKAVCVPPYLVSHVSKWKYQNKADFKIATVVGFPLGYNDLAVKTQECKTAFEDGVDEIDAVINVSAVKSGDWDLITDEFDRLSTFLGMKGKVLKIIFETAYLTREEIAKLCSLCLKFGVDFAKTSTGFAHSGADIDTIAFMKSVLGDKVKIKASGGIRDAETALKMIAAGASRIGTSSGLKIIGK